MFRAACGISGNPVLTRIVYSGKGQCSFPLTYMAPYGSKSVSDLMHCSLSQPNFVNEDTGPWLCAVRARGEYSST